MPIVSLFGLVVYEIKGDNQTLKGIVIERFNIAAVDTVIVVGYMQ